jgi:protein involved in polysaccharide export with SLBB domain
MRNIKLIRENKTEEPVDLYKFLLEGDKSQDYRLSASDTILVMPIGDVFGIAGNVKQPAIYEIPSPIKLKALLEISGGVNPVGYLQRIQVERVYQHQKKIVLDLEFKDALDLKKSSEEIELQDGDLVLIYPIGPLKRNYASITGNVQRPGDYELKTGMTVKDIIDKAGGFLPGTHMERADVMRTHGQKNKKVIPVDLYKIFAGDTKENMPVEEWDQITVYAKSDVSPVKFVGIDGAVNNPGQYELTDDMLISDLVFVAGGLKQSASEENAELFRVAGDDQQPELLRINLFNILNKKMGSTDFALKEGDHLYVRERAEYAQEKVIKLTGEFKYPGDYVIRKGERLSSIISRAGGFTDRAYLKGAVFTRKSVKELQKEMVRKFVESEQQAILQEEGSLAIGTSGSQSSARKELIEYRNNQIKTLESVGIFGRVVINLDETDKIQGTEDDILLEGDDALYVPERPSVIQVVGNVRNQNIVTYKAKRGVDYYLAKAGGLTKNADKRGIFIIKANGEAVGTFAKIRYLEPGDTIVVPEAFKYKTPTGIIFKDAFQFTAQIATLALALSAVK